MKNKNRNREKRERKKAKNKSQLQNFAFYESLTKNCILAPGRESQGNAKCFGKFSFLNGGLQTHVELVKWLKQQKNTSGTE